MTSMNKNQHNRQTKWNCHSDYIYPQTILMKATKEFFESLREEINNASPVVTETKEERPSRMKVIDLFAGVGGLDLGNVKLQHALTCMEAEMNIKDAEIERLKAELRTRASEMAYMKSKLEKHRIEMEARDLGINPDDLRNNPTSVPPEVRAKYDADAEAEMNRAQDEPEAFGNELIEMLEDARQRESELRDALEQEQKRHEEVDGIERLPMSAFIGYAEDHYPSDQNKSAKILKEALGDVYNIRKIDDETYDRWKQLGTKESFDDRLADGMKRIADRPMMKDNNGIVAGGSVTARITPTDEQFKSLISQSNPSLPR